MGVAASAPRGLTAVQGTKGMVDEHLARSSSDPFRSQLVQSTRGTLRHRLVRQLILHPIDYPQYVASRLSEDLSLRLGQRVPHSMETG